MHIGRRAGLALVMVVAACEAKAPPPIEFQRAVTAASGTRVLVPRGDVWSWSATGGCCSEYTDAPAPIGYGETYLATTIPSGSDPAHKPITVYFKKDVAIPDATSIVGLHFDMMVDDGIVVYLDGHEVARHNMPAGVITPTTLALPHEAQNTYERVDLDVANLQLFGGGNRRTLLAEVHQADSASSDLVFDLSLVADTSTAPVPPAEPTTKGGIPRGSVWSYWDRGGDLGPSTLDRGGDATADWRTTTTLIGFAEGPGPLGYGEDYLATTVGYAGPLQRKNLTTYFRKDFVGLPGDLVKSIAVELMYDDGVVFYLNGQKLGSYSMPAGETTSDTRAFDHEANNTYQVFDWTEFKHKFHPGDNTLAVEVHQTAETSSDVVFDLALHIEPLATPTITRRGLWRYWDGGGDLGTAWRAGSYDDSRWSTAIGPLGYGENYLTSTVSFGADANHKPVTTYCRKKIHVEDATLVRAVRGEWMYDDGLVATLNGHELARPGMPAGAITASTYALGHEANNAYERFEVPLAAGWVVNGDNELAVEVHQASDASSDLVFDASIEGIASP